MNSRSVKDKARRFLSLPSGWCHGWEKPPSLRTVDHACLWIDRAYALGLQADVILGDDNSIVVSAIKNDHSLDIEVSDDKILLCAEELGIGFDYEEVMSKLNPSSKEVQRELLRISIEDYKIYVSEVPLNYADNIIALAELRIFQTLQQDMDTWKCMSGSLIQKNINQRRNDTTKELSKNIMGIYPSLTRNAQKEKVVQFVNISENTMRAYTRGMSRLDSCKSFHLILPSTAKIVTSDASRPLVEMTRAIVA